MPSNTPLPQAFVWSSFRVFTDNNRPKRPLDLADQTETMEKFVSGFDWEVTRPNPEVLPRPWFNDLSNFSS